MRIPWEFSGFAFYINPSEDNGWVLPSIVAELSPINAGKSTIQHGGFKSSRRQVQGFLIGPHAKAQKEKFDGWLRSKTIGSLKDHFGESKRAMLIRFEATTLQDIKSVRNGYGSWRYSAEWIEMG